MGYAKKEKRGRARKCRRQEGGSSLVRKTEKIGCETETSSREKRNMWKTDSEEIKREKKGVGWGGKRVDERRQGGWECGEGERSSEKKRKAPGREIKWCEEKKVWVWEDWVHQGGR